MAEVVERGDVYFLFRPKVQAPGEGRAVAGPEDVQRFFMVMHPQGKKTYRLAVLGRKRLPEMSGRRERLWGFIDRVEKDAEALHKELGPETYATKTRGMRKRPAARAAGEGVYSLIRHDGHTHFAYALELPRQTGEVQQEFQIENEASYIISVKNPRQPSPAGAGLPQEEKAALPKSQQARFHGRRFINPDPPDVLDHSGAEFILVAATEDPGRELGVDLKPEEESAASAEIFRDLRLRRSEVPLEPLFKGEWR